MEHVYPNDGQWIQVLRKGDKLICCDCNLVHKIEFKTVDKKIYFRAWRDNPATKQARKKRRPAGEFTKAMRQFRAANLARAQARRKRY